MENIIAIFQSEIADAELASKLQAFSVSATQFLIFLGVFIGSILLISSMTRLLLGKKAQLNYAVTSAIEIFFVYVVTVVIYALGLKLQQFLSPLPYVTIVEDYLVFFPILSADFSLICVQALDLLIIAFLVNLINAAVPRGSHLITWLFLRILIVIASIAAIYGINWLGDAYLPQDFSEFAPMILIIVLVVLVLLGSLKLLVGGMIAFLDPIIAVLYTFFFANVVGRALAKAMFTTVLLTGLIITLHALEIIAIPIASSILTGYIPLLLIAFGLWLLVGRVFIRE